MSELPTAVVEAVERARQAHAKGMRSDAEKALDQAFGLISFPCEGYDATFPLLSELTPVQRALCDLIGREGLPAPFQRMPTGPSTRRWLGLDPPGPLEREVNVGDRRIPLWRALREARDGEEEAFAAVKALPVGERLAIVAMFEGMLWTYRINPKPQAAWPLVDELAAEGRTWALATMKNASDVPDLGRMLAFFALVRAGEPIDPVWDAFLPIATHVPTKIAVECAGALTLERLEAVAPALLAATFGPRAIEIGTAILHTHDSQAIARSVVERTKKSFPHHRKVERAALTMIAQTQPGVAAVLKAAHVRAPASKTVKKKAPAKKKRR